VLLFSALVAPRAHAACSIAGLPVGTEIATIETPLGSICIELLRADAPAHVANFLFYLENGSMEGTFFHRNLPGFVLQGGGFVVGASDFEPIPADNGPVTNEPCTLDIPDPNNPGGSICSVRGNERGTVALAKLGGQPSSGTTNWFINLADNRSNLDNQNGGFTVFGRVVGGTMATVDAIAALAPATEDDLVWLQTVFTSFTDLPLQQPSLSSGFGCWDPTVQAAVLDPNFLPNSGVAVPDPVVAPFPYTVSAACGTSTTIDDFLLTWPNAGPSECPDEDLIAMRITGPGTFQAIQPFDFYNLTCEQTVQSMGDRASWITSAFKPHLYQQLVTIDLALVFTASAAVPAISPLGGALVAGLMLLSGWWLIRRRPSPSEEP
jgi:cyclophilin family peptidyl-prolyl cis-trans isomerase